MCDKQQSCTHRNVEFVVSSWTIWAQYTVYYWAYFVLKSVLEHVRDWESVRCKHLNHSWQWPLVKRKKKKKKIHCILKPN